MKVSNIIIDDLEEIENIGKVSLPIYYKQMELLFLLLDKSYTKYKLSKENNILGFVIIKYFPDENRHHIMSIAVLPKYRKNNVGTTLINKILKLNSKKISLYVLTTNIAAINFYEKNKFIKKKTILDYYKTLETQSAYYYVLNKS